MRNLIETKGKEGNTGRRRKRGPKGEKGWRRERRGEGRGKGEKKMEKGRERKKKKLLLEVLAPDKSLAAISTSVLPGTFQVDKDLRMTKLRGITTTTHHSVTINNDGLHHGDEVLGSRGFVQLAVPVDFVHGFFVVGQRSSLLERLRGEESRLLGGKSEEGGGRGHGASGGATQQEHRSSHGHCCCVESGFSCVFCTNWGG